MFLGNLVHPPTAIMRRDRLRAAGAYEPNVTGDGGDDYHFYYRVCEKGPVALLDAPTILYRLHESQIVTSRKLQEARADLRIVTHWLARHRPDLPSSVIRARVASARTWVGQEELEAGNRRVATAHLWKGLLLDPMRPRAALLLVLSLLPAGAIPTARAAKRALRTVASGLTLRRAS